VSINDRSRHVEKALSLRIPVSVFVSCLFGKHVSAASSGKEQRGIRYVRRAKTVWKELSMALIARARMTKEFLMGLQAGLYIASNTFQPDRPGKPRFAETVATPEEREAQWQRAKAACADGRLCNAYQHSEDHEHWTRTICWR